VAGSLPQTITDCSVPKIQVQTMTRVMIIDDLEYIKILGHMVNLCFAKRIENRIDLTLTYGPLDLDLTAI
jgi:hypothetical protein